MRRLVLVPFSPIRHDKSTAGPGPAMVRLPNLNRRVAEPSQRSGNLVQVRAEWDTQPLVYSGKVVEAAPDSQNVATLDQPGK